MRASFGTFHFCVAYLHLFLFRKPPALLIPRCQDCRQVSVYKALVPVPCFIAEPALAISVIIISRQIVKSMYKYMAIPVIWSQCTTDPKHVGKDSNKTWIYCTEIPSTYTHCPDAEEAPDGR
jgi:hypothetical protein